MFAGLGAVVIYDSVLFNRTGQVRRWADGVERGFTMNARRAAPYRSGDLVAGIHGYTERLGPKMIQAIIESTADHTWYVLAGTTGPIVSTRLLATGWSFGMPIGRKAPAMGPLPPHGGHRGGFKKIVSGQAANNFFDTAAEATARTHPSLRGFHPDVGPLY